MSVPAQWLTLVGSDVDWGFRTTPQAGLDNAVLQYPRGKVLGGSSGINAMTHVRADRSSYDRWAADGAIGWGFEDLLPYFRRSENAPGRDPQLRGTDGPLTVQHTTNPHPAAEAFFAACQERGYPVSDDLNGAQTGGVCWFDQNIVDGKRQSAADAYLRPALGRPNLTVFTDALVTGLTFTGTSCTGVNYRQGPAPENSPLTPSAKSSCAPEPSARHICCCSQALGPPISFAGTVSTSSQTCRVWVPICPTIHWTRLSTPRLSRSRWDSTTSSMSLAACRVDPSSAAPDAHMLFLAVPFVPPGRTAPENGYTIAFSMLRPHSRGSVQLASSDPTAAPLIDPAFLTDQRDVDFMVRAARAARELGAGHALQTWRR